MYTYQIKEKHGSTKRHIAFNSLPENEDFRNACEKALSKHGFALTYDGHYFYANHPNKNSPLAQLCIESDEWGSIWGEGAPFKSMEENHQAVETLALLLNESGLFCEK